MATEHPNVPLLFGFAQGENGWDDEYNDAMSLIGALLQCVVSSFGLSSPPPSPANYSLHIIGSGPSGAWAGQAWNLAYKIPSGWRFVAPKPGWVARGIDGKEYLFGQSFTWAEARAPSERVLDRLITSSTLTPVATDEGLVLVCQNSTGTAVTFTRGLYPRGIRIHFFQDAAGQVTFANSTNVSVVVSDGTAKKTRAQNSLVTAWLKSTDGGSDIWILTGELEVIA